MSSVTTDYLGALIGLTFCLLCFNGCQDGDACTSAQDCFSDQVCVDNTCKLTSSINVGDMMSSDMTDQSGDQSTDQSPSVSCRTPTSKLCTEDDYERESTFDYRIKPDAWHFVGCKGFSDDAIIGLDKTVSGTLCRTDTKGDVFSVEYNRCRKVGYIMTMTLTVKTPCEPTDYEVEWISTCAGQLVCNDSKPKPHVYVREFIVPTVSSNIPTNLFSFKLSQQTPGVELEYDLHVSVKQP